MAKITLSYDSRNTSVRKILQVLLDSGLVKEERSETKAEKAFRRSFKEAMEIKQKLISGNTEGLSSLDDLLNEL